MAEENEIALNAVGAIAQITGAETDMQIATAKRYPRELEKFKKNVELQVTADIETAMSMGYKLEREDKETGEKKDIIGPSVRFAEVCALAWGNLRVGTRIIDIDEFQSMGVENVIKEARRVVGDGQTYVSFDVDALDPVYAPGTGTPEIGGLTTLEAQHLIRGLRGLNLIGGDVVEVSPPFDASGNTALVASTLLFEILCVLADSLATRNAR